VVDNRGGGERRPGRSDRDGAPRFGNRSKPPSRSGADRARRSQPQGASPHSADDRTEGPRIPATVDAKQLAPEVRRELSTLDKTTADTIARHLVAAGELLDEDPEAALEHARAARQRSGRIAAIREAVGIAAYRCGDWAQALAELRAARRHTARTPNQHRWSGREYQGVRVNYG